MPAKDGGQRRACTPQPSGCHRFSKPRRRARPVHCP